VDAGNPQCAIVVIMQNFSFHTDSITTINHSDTVS